LPAEWCAQNVRKSLSELVLRTTFRASRPYLDATIFSSLTDHRIASQQWQMIVRLRGLRQYMLASKVQMLEQIARDSVASGRENNAIGAIRLLAELTGFGVEQKR